MAGNVYRVRVGLNMECENLATLIVYQRLVIATTKLYKSSYHMPWLCQRLLIKRQTSLVDGQRCCKKRVQWNPLFVIQVVDTQSNFGNLLTGGDQVTSFVSRFEFPCWESASPCDLCIPPKNTAYFQLEIDDRRYKAKKSTILTNEPLKQGDLFWAVTVNCEVSTSPTERQVPWMLGKADQWRNEAQLPPQGKLGNIC